ncbi:hypothetical protein QBC38DRAFT_141309 [Podospora fimiseda]|uniref:Uncharacterized protein n=1 Tax=Podospora fimiseda TaxID=252190 RepID=A0AAN7BTJ7_9PEZI|nr:hypothetical protein QBC38DRAFT_141309 [Podospora fimiseda]
MTSRAKVNRGKHIRTFITAPAANCSGCSSGNENSMICRETLVGTPFRRCLGSAAQISSLSKKMHDWLTVRMASSNLSLTGSFRWSSCGTTQTLGEFCCRHTIPGAQLGLFHVLSRSMRSWHQALRYYGNYTTRHECARLLERATFLYQDNPGQAATATTKKETREWEWIQHRDSPGVGMLGAGDTRGETDATLPSNVSSI